MLVLVAATQAGPRHPNGSRQSVSACLVLSEAASVHFVSRVKVSNNNCHIVSHRYRGIKHQYDDMICCPYCAALFSSHQSKGFLLSYRGHVEGQLPLHKQRLEDTSLAVIRL